MRKILITLGIILMLTGTGFTADGDISQTEVIPDVSTWKLDSVEFFVIDKTAVITYRKGYLSGSNFITTGKKRIKFIDISDNPYTENIDETITDFTDLINYINSKSNIKSSIKTVVKTKLGI